MNPTYQEWYQEEYGHLNNLYQQLITRLGLIVTFDLFCEYVYKNSKRPHFN